MKLDPTQMQDWEIAAAAEETMRPFMALGRDAGLTDDELIPVGRRLGKVDSLRAMARLAGRRPSKYIDADVDTGKVKGLF